MALPNCLLIGAMRSGTSTVYQLLGQHPDVFMSTPKEPDFFAVPEGEKMVIESSRALTDRSAYEALFAEGASSPIRGEASHSYLYYSDRAAPRIKATLDDVKLVALLRNPVDRAFSHFVLHTRNQQEEAATFAEALDREEERIASGTQFGHYLNRGFYAKQLRPYLDAFDRSSIKVYLYEDLAEDTAGLMKDLYGFLGVAEGFDPDVSVRSNPSGVPRNQAVHRILVRDNAVKRAIQPLLPRAAYRWAVGVRDRNLDRPSIDPDLRSELVATYRSDIEELQGMIGRDLSSWLQ